MAAKKKKKKAGKKKAGKKRAAKRKSAKKRSGGGGRKSKAARIALQVKSEGRTADGKAGLYRGYLKGQGGRVDLGIVTAPDATTARRKLGSIARGLTK